MLAVLAVRAMVEAASMLPADQRTIEQPLNETVKLVGRSSIKFLCMLCMGKRCLAVRPIFD